MRRSRASWTFASLSTSRPAIGSSRIRMGAFRVVLDEGFCQRQRAPQVP
jgi:hypothetical protein